MKNPETVLEAFLQGAGSTSRLLLVGDGHLRKSLAGRVEADGLGDRVVLTGLVPRDDVYRVLRIASLFVSASRGEGLPVAALEAMACSCPVILSDIPPHREIARGVDFIPLVPADDVEGFAAEIERFSAMTLAERSEVARRCRDHVVEHFSLHRMHSQYERLYRELSENGPRLEPSHHREAA